MVRALLCLMLLSPILAHAEGAAPSSEDGVPSPDGDAGPPADDVPSPEEQPAARARGGESDASAEGVPSPERPEPPRDSTGVPTPGEDTSPGGSADEAPLPAATGDAPPAEGEPFPPAPGPPSSASEGTEGAASTLARPSDVLFEEGKALFADGGFDAAILDFEEILRRDPDDADARNYLVESLRALERDDDAQAVLDGAMPLGEPTPVEDDGPHCSGNPRADHRFSAGLGLGGPGVGISVWGEVRPYWLLAVSGGAGAFALVDGPGSVSGLGSVYVGADALPLPLPLTPVIGVGLAAVFGDAVWRLDALVKPVVGGPAVRLVPYLNIGARLDLGRLQVQGGLWLVPTGDRALPLIPVPGARLGVLF